MPNAPAPVKTVPGKGRFETCLAHLLKLEGSFSNNPNDRGGATNHGISLRFAVAESRLDPHVRRLLDVDMDGDVDYLDIRGLSREAAAEVYRRCFWGRYRCGELKPRMDSALFDQAVNGGGVSAVKLLQQAVNLARRWPDLVVDGRIGPMTIIAANKTEPDLVVNFMRRLAEGRYRAIVDDDPSQRVFLRGWLARAAVLGHV